MLVSLYLGILFSLTACFQQKIYIEDGFDQTNKEQLRKFSGFNWFKDKVDYEVRHEKTSYALPKSHPNTLKANYILSQIYPQAIKIIPKNQRDYVPYPQLRIVKNTRINNDYNSTRSICSDYTISFKKIHNTKVDRSGSFILSRKHGIMRFWKHAYCSKSIPWSENRLFIEWALTALDGLCTYKIDHDQKHIWLDDDCQNQFTQEWQIIGGTHNFMVSLNTNMIILDADQYGDDFKLPFIIAHELAHYLKGHGALVNYDYYDFFYQLTEENFFKMPQPSFKFSVKTQNYNKLISELKWLKNNMKYKDNIFFDKKQQFHPGILAFFREQPSFFSSHHVYTCSALELVLQEINNSEPSNSEQKPKKIDEKLISDFEAKLDACIKTLPKNQNFLVQEFLNEFSHFDPAFMKHLPFKALSNTQVFSQFLDELNQQLKENVFSIAPYDEIYDHYGQKLIGLYTYEQEADELAVQWLMDSSIDATNAIFFWLQKSAENNENFMGVSCQQLYKRKWIHPKTGKIYMPIGFMEDEHHNYCFRAFEAWRIITGRKKNISYYD